MEPDPYAAPEGPRPKKRKKRDRVDEVDLTPHRMSIVTMVLLHFATFGLYSVIWYFQRKPAFEALRQERLSPFGFVIGYLVTWAVIIQSTRTHVVVNPLWLVAFAGMVAVFLAQRQLSQVINTAAYARGLDIELSPIALWFFGAPYLQHGLNRLATERAD